MSDLLKPCIDCGELSDGPRCLEHRPAPMPKTSAHSRGYDYQWTKLSKRARKLQPFCADCGTTTDLQTDHSEEAWARKKRGLMIRLQDVDVVCGDCNRKRGAARHPGGKGPDKREQDPPGKAKFQLVFINSNRDGVV